LHRFIARLTPATVKRLVHGRFYGYHRSGVELPIEFSADARGPFVWVDRRLQLRFREEERDELEYHMVRNGGSIEETSGFLGLAAPANVFFDVGAAKAMYARLFCLCGLEKQAVMFEPSPTQMAAAVAAIAENECASRICLRQCAVGSEPGRTSGVFGENGFVSVCSTTADGIPVEVEVTSLDREVETLGLVPDLIKIDVEGYELEVIRGARRLLETRKPPICLELHLGILETRGISPRQVVEPLQECGYRFRTHLGRELKPSAVWDSIHAVLRCIAY
jgi:FkbM family methyltransferase